MTENKSRITVLKNQLQHAIINSPMGAKAWEGAMTIFENGKGLHLYRCNKEQRGSGDSEIVIRQSVYRRIVDHLSSNTSREQGGLLLGYEIYSANPNTSLVFVTHSLPAQYSEGTPARLAFTEDTWAKFDEQTDELQRFDPALLRVGWYHSHPGMDIFLSAHDLDVCSNFTRPTQIALVVDPVYDRGGFFIRGKEGFRQYTPQGFWELHDLKQETIVTWKNLSLIESNIEIHHQVDQSASRKQVSEAEISPPKDDAQISISQPNSLSGSASGEPGESLDLLPLENRGYRYGVPLWAFILVVAAFTGLFLWTTVGSMRRTGDFLYNLDSRLIKQENSMKEQANRLEHIEQGLISHGTSNINNQPQKNATTPASGKRRAGDRPRPVARPPIRRTGGIINANLGNSNLNKPVNRNATVLGGVSQERKGMANSNNSNKARNYP